MKTVELIGYRREDLKKSTTKRLREEGNVPCVLYGGENNIHFYSPMILFRDLVYTSEAHFVSINIEGEEHKAILQDVQFHPVSEIILHADFLQLQEGKKIRMDIPVHLVGQAPGVGKGGTLVHKRRNLSIMALPQYMPEYIEVDISELDFHKAIKVEEIRAENYEILDTPIASIAVVEVPRALIVEEEAEAEAEEGLEEEALEEGAEAEGAEGGEEAKGGEGEEGKSDEGDKE